MVNVPHPGVVLMKHTLDERGVSAILVTASLVLLMGMAALAIDLGAGWNERRQDQTASDLAAVAGALSYGEPEGDIVDQVLSIARSNLDNTYTDPAWYSLWTGCSDPERPAGFTPLTSSSGDTIDCISRNVSFLRVRLPEQVIATSFGRVLGVQTLSTHAYTVVTILPEGGTGLLPFAVRSGSTAGELCLDTGTGRTQPPCGRNESGSFGNIAPPLFGNPFIGTTPDCSHQTSANNYVPDSIAMGIDHIIWRFSSADWAATGWDPGDNTSNNAVDAVANMDECTDTGGEVAEAADGLPIEAVYVDTGNNTKADVTEGLVTGTNFPDGDDARLTRSSNTRSLDGYQLDNTPLWAHLLPANGASGHGIAYCDRAAFDAETDLTTKNDMMRTCLADYQANGESVQIFSDSILTTPRFGVAPVLWHDNLGSGMSYRPVKEFGLVYVAGVWLNDSNSNPTTFYPDDDDSTPITPKKKKWVVEQVTAFLLTGSMVSEKVQDFYPGFDEDSLDPIIYE